MKYIVAAMCVVCALAACSPEQAARSADLPAADLQRPAAPVGDQLAKPAVPILNENRGYKRAIASWDEFVSLQTPSDQAYLEDLEHRYFGVIAFDTAEEGEYMRRAGFPSPEDWLEAKRMTDAQLQHRADSGDSKAAGMLADRMSVRLDELQAQARLSPGAVPDADLARVATMAVAYASRAMDGSKSPFGLYVEGMVKSSIFDSWEPMTAAMLESMNRGDPRVDRLIAELHARHPVQDIESIHVALRGMRRHSP